MPSCRHGAHRTAGQLPGWPTCLFLGPCLPPSHTEDTQQSTQERKAQSRGTWHPGHTASTGPGTRGRVLSARPGLRFLSPLTLAARAGPSLRPHSGTPHPAFPPARRAGDRGVSAVCPQGSSVRRLPAGGWEPPPALRGCLLLSTFPRKTFSFPVSGRGNIPLPCWKGVSSSLVFSHTRRPLLGTAQGVTDAAAFSPGRRGGRAPTGGARAPAAAGTPPHCEASRSPVRHRAPTLSRGPLAGRFR